MHWQASQQVGDSALRQAERKEVQGEASFWKLLVMLLMHLCPDSERHEQPWDVAESGKEAEAAELPTDFSHALLSVTVCACAVYTHTVYVVFVHYARGCVKIEAALLALLMCMHRCKKKPL